MNDEAKCIFDIMDMRVHRTNVQTVWHDDVIWSHCDEIESIKLIIGISTGSIYIPSQG